MSLITPVTNRLVSTLTNQADVPTQEGQALESDVSMEQVLAQLIQPNLNPDTFTRSPVKNDGLLTESYPPSTGNKIVVPQVSGDVVAQAGLVASPGVAQALADTTNKKGAAPGSVAPGVATQADLKTLGKQLVASQGVLLAQPAKPQGEVRQTGEVLQGQEKPVAVSGGASVQSPDRVSTDQIEKIITQMGLLAGTEVDASGKMKSAEASGILPQSEGKMFSGTDYLYALQGASQKKGEQSQNQAQQDRTAAAPPLPIQSRSEGQRAEMLQFNPSAFESKLASVTPELIQPVQMNSISTAYQAAPEVLQRPPMVVTGHVVPGSMTRNRLSSEAVIGLSSGVKSLAGNGGGEIRIRLRPDNLGELNLKVTTLGNQVGLKIQASDEGARKIIEETLGSLKEKLATQNLSLGRVEITLAMPATARGAELFGNSTMTGGNDAFQPQQQSAGHQNQSGHWNGTKNSDEQANGGSSGLTRGESAARGHPAAQPVWANASSNRASNGRVDLMA